MSDYVSELLNVRHRTEDRGLWQLAEQVADELATLRTRLAEVEARYARAEKAIEIADDQVTKLEAESGRLRHSLERAALDLRGVSGFVYTGPTDDHMRKAAALIEAAIDRARAALAQTTEKDHD